FGSTIRLISSHVSAPTSPIQSSFVPGLKVNRNGFRNPYATIRRAFGSELPASGLSAIPAPVEGFSRRSVPLRGTGCPAGRRRLWLRSAPPSAVGAVIAPPTPPGGSAQGFLGVGLPALPPPWP